MSHARWSRARQIAVVALASLSTFSTVAACELIQGITATKIVSGLVIATPEVKVAGAFDVPSQTVATAWVGQRDSPTSTAEPSPLRGVAVAVTASGNRVTLTEESGTPGVYVATSIDNAKLTYSAAAKYALDATIQGTVYGNDADAPPRLDSGSLTFTPALGATGTLPGVRSHARSAALTVQWPSTAGRYAYVSVFRSKTSAATQPDLVFDTRPKTAGEILSFVLGEPKTQIEIPGDKFATPGVYAVVVVAMNKGTPRSGTFSGSPMLVGSGAAVVMSVQ